MKKKYIIISLAIILILCVAFIFSNSLKNGAQSTDMSGTAKEILVKALSFFNIDIDISEQSIRTLGHFAEFFALSMILTLTAIFIFPVDFKNLFTKRLIIYFSPVVISFLIACVDEFIQLFSPGRACDIMDVLVDVIGAATANLIIMGIIFIIYAIKKRKD